MARRFTASHLWQLPRVGPPVVGGTTIIAPVSTYDIDEDGGHTVLYRIDPETKVPIALTDPSLNATSPAISSDGSCVAFLRADTTGNKQLFVLSLQGGEARQVTNLPLGVEGPKWLPDGRILAVVPLLADAPTVEGTRDRLTNGAKSSAIITDARIYRFWDRWLSDVHHLAIIHPTDGEMVDITPQDHFQLGHPSLRNYADQIDLSRDGTTVTFSARVDQKDDSIPIWRLYSVPTEGGSVSCLTKNDPGNAIWPRYSPDGSHIAFLYQTEPDFYADQQRLALLNPSTGERTELTEDWDRSIGSFEFESGSGDIVFTAEEDARVKVFRIRTQGGTPQLVVDDHTITNIRPTPSGAIYARRQSLSQPPEVVRIRDEKVEQVTDFSDAVLDDVDLGRAESVSFAGAGGDTVQMFVVYPPDFDPTTKWPLVHMIHGGPHATFGDMWHFRWNSQAFAAFGYVVALFNFHGSTSFGDAFTRSIHGRWGDQPAADIHAGTDHLIDQGFIDGQRIAITGGSYGGYLTSWLTSQSDRFACSIAHAAVTNLGGMYATDGTHGFARSRGAHIWEDRNQVEKWSPSAHSAGYRTPTLVIHGERDYRVPVTQGLELYGVLKAKGVPARLIYFPDENHWILKPQNSLTWYREVQEWLSEWL